MQHKRSETQPTAAAAATADDSSRSKQSWWRQASNAFLLLMLVSMLLGAALGCLLRFGFGVSSPRAARFIGFPGQIWMDLLRCMIIPLATITIMTSVLQQKIGSTQRVAVLVFGYYLSTTVLAACTGVLPILLLRPGDYGANNGAGQVEGQRQFEGDNTIPFVDSVFDLLRNLFPDSFIAAMLQVRRSAFPQNSTDVEDIRVVSVPGINVMGLIVLSAVFATIVRQIPSGDQLKSLILSLFDVTVTALHWLKWASPVGLLFLIAQRVLEMRDVTGSAVGLGLFLLLFSASLLVHGLLVLMCLFLIVTRRSPIAFLKQALPAAATAFATSSSAATMGVSRECCVEGLGVRAAVADFMIPIGANLNMDGGAIHLAGSAIFIAQLNSIPLTMGRIVLIVFSAFAFAVGGAAVPSAGLISLQMTLHASSLPVHDVPLLVAVEWITDRSLTVVNVLGDLYGCCIVEQLFNWFWGSSQLDAQVDAPDVIEEGLSEVELEERSTNF